MKLAIDNTYISPQQKQFLQERHKYVGYGGARGGGKSWVVRTKAKLNAAYLSGIKQLIVRRTYPELVENHIKWLRAETTGLARYNDRDKVLRFINGSEISFTYCQRDSDLDHIQGGEWDIIYIDEATQMSEYQIKAFWACMRGANNFPKRCYMTCNPGGQGHGFYKRIFIDRNYEGNEKPEDFSFIQALVTDNRALMEFQPDYKEQLEALPPKIRDAWLYGRWDVYEGQFFEDWQPDPPQYKCDELGMTAEELRQRRQWCHVIKPFMPPKEWMIYRSYDFGYAKPFSCAWWAVDYDGRIYRILELYGCTDEPNTGVKWTPDQQFAEIARIERDHPYLAGREIHGVADPSIWDGSRGESVAETAMRHGVYFTPGDNDRIPGWMQCHYRLAFDHNGYPMMYVFENCKAFIRTIPLLMYDEIKVEDLDTSMEDHCLRGDTQVLTDKGYRNISDLVGTEGLVMSHDGKYHRYHDVRCTKRNAPLLKVELEDGTTIYCTDEHRFMLPDGEWIHADELVPGMDINAKVWTVTRTLPADVYNMEVEDTHDFVIQGGVISHNCSDEWRYLCMARPIKPIHVEEKKPVLFDPLNQFDHNERYNATLFRRI